MASTDLPMERDPRGCVMDSNDVSWKSYVDAIFNEHRVHVEAALAAADAQVKSSRAQAAQASEALRREFQSMLDPGLGVGLKDHIDSVFVEGRRATEIAERERGAAALALRSEQQRAQDVAEREREKAAQALAGSLAQAIKEGDDRLREHIGNQVEQIKAALEAVEGRAALRAEASRTQLDDRFGYTEAAVAKAEQANEKRFESVNEFRGQLSDQAALFLPREVADTQFANLQRRLEAQLEALTGIRGTFVTREAFDARVDDMSKQIARLTEALGKLT